MAAPSDPTISRARNPVAQVPEGVDLRRERERRVDLNVDKQKIANRVIDFATRDIENREEERQRRIQRMAKVRMWEEATNDFPWPDSSNYAVPDLATGSLRTQDTLHNAFMTHRPPIEAKSVLRTNRDRERTIDELIDHQFFAEQDGEKVLEEAAETFVNDGCLTVYIPWIRERRPVSKAKFFPRIPRDMVPAEYFRTLMDQEFPQSQHRRREEQGWDWEVYQGDEQFDVSFYTERSSRRVRMVVHRVLTVFDGPRFLVKDLDQVLYPTRSANLQPPGPSNPDGAPHVILVDYPTLDELKKLQKDGFYDKVSMRALKGLDTATRDTADEDREDQRDDFQGHIDDRLRDKQHTSQTTFTRYTCFDRFDIDGDGLDEDVVWWVLKENKLLLKAAVMTEFFPLDPPRRPFAESTFLPVKGRREGIGLPELMESTHDLMKILWDQMVDAGTLLNSPFGFYRPQSNVKPEVFRIFPGDMYPLNDPSRDVAFPNLGTAGQAFHINTITKAEALEEKLTVIGDLSFGRIPTGKSAALRTATGIQSVMSQGEARPERILRRFFMCWRQAWWIAHQLNQHFLTDNKQFRIVGYKPANADPYRAVASRESIGGDYEFEFKANVGNSSKVALQQSIAQAMEMVMNPLSIQMGVVTPDKVYNIMFDALRALGVDGDHYLNSPDPMSTKPRILAEEAISEIIQGRAPFGNPLEPGGWQEHISKLIAFQNSQEFGVLDASALRLWRTYLEMAGQSMQQEQQQAAQVMAAQGGSGGPPQQPGPPGSGPGNMQPPPVQGGELLDESLPTAGGGGNVGVQ